MTDPTTTPAPDAAASAGEPNTPPAAEAPPAQAPAPEDSAPPAAPADPLAQAQQDAAYWKDVAMRAAAELENYRKRVARDMQEAAKFANSALLEQLLPILDNFDYGMQAAKQENEGSNLYIGLTMVLKQVQDFLTGQGVQEIPAVGLPFDPNVHEAVSQQASDEVPEGIVLHQMRKGYRLRERLLRPSTVIVSSGPQTAA